MKISIVSGSHRKVSQSEKVAQYISTSLSQHTEGVDPFLYSLGGNPLPLWDESLWAGDAAWTERLSELKAQLVESDAFVFVTPEWHGQVPAGLKNFLLLFSRFELGHKPALIVSISSGVGGANPVSELRMSSAKNNRLCYIPEQLIVRNVGQVFNLDEADNDAKAQSYLDERLQWCLDLLIGYGKALKTLRAETKVHHDKFQNGM